MVGLSRRGFLKASGATALLLNTAHARANEAADVIVLGAGLAGLHAALQLADTGASVIVLEAKERPGGRVQTLFDLPGIPEAGGTQLSSNYRRFVGLAERFEIPLMEDSPMQRDGPPELYVAMRGHSVLPDQWAGHSLNPFDGPLANLPPWALPFAAMGRDNPLPEIASWRDPDFAEWDKPVSEHLGWTSEQLRLGFGINPGYGASAYSQSTLMWFQIMKAIVAPGARLLTVDGGNQRVPNAMAATLGDRVRFGRAARHIENDADGVTVRTMDGSTYRGRDCIITLPTSALRTVDIDPAPPRLQQRGIRSLPYNRVVRAYFVPERRYWEEDGLPPSIWSDSYAGRVFALRGGGGTEITMMQSFITGRAAELLDRMPQSDAMALIQAEIERIRPAARGALRPVAYVSWGNDPYAGGAYACWAPGQISAFADAVSQPHGRLTFAGEHTAVRARGIEGALESAERAVREVTARN